MPAQGGIKRRQQEEAQLKAAEVDLKKEYTMQQSRLRQEQVCRCSRVTLMRPRRLPRAPKVLFA
jgi:hypothetical protein